jgi:hypothetical protein
MNTYPLRELQQLESAIRRTSPIIVPTILPYDEVRHPISVRYVSRYKEIAYENVDRVGNVFISSRFSGELVINRLNTLTSNELRYIELALQPTSESHTAIMNVVINRCSIENDKNVKLLLNSVFGACCHVRKLTLVNATPSLLFSLFDSMQGYRRNFNFDKIVISDSPLCLMELIERGVILSMPKQIQYIRIHTSRPTTEYTRALAADPDAIRKLFGSPSHAWFKYSSNGQWTPNSSLYSYLDTFGRHGIDTDRVHFFFAVFMHLRPYIQYRMVKYRLFYLMQFITAAMFKHANAITKNSMQTYIIIAGMLIFYMPKFDVDKNCKTRADWLRDSSARFVSLFSAGPASMHATLKYVKLIN